MSTNKLITTAKGVVKEAQDLINGVASLSGKTVTNKKDTTKQTNELAMVFDREWLKGTFIISDEDAVNTGEYGQWIRANRYSSSANIKFTSTAPGMSVAINPKPQFTRYCDIRNKGRMKSRPDVTLGTRGWTTGLGMGRYYSEAIDDNQQRIFLRFGTPQYSSMLLWITKSFDVHKAALANRGIITSILLSAVNLVTKVFAIWTNPLLFGLKVLFNALLQPGRFVSVRDNMYVYWAGVENILNSMVVRRTMAPQILSEGMARLDSNLGQEQTVTPAFLKALNEMIPDVIDAETGRISVFAIALRGQASFNKMMAKDLDKAQNYDMSSDFTDYPITGEKSHDTYMTDRKGDPTFFLKRIFKTAYDTWWELDGKPEEDAAPTMISTNILETDIEGKPLTIFSDPNEMDQDAATERTRLDNIKNKKEALNKYGDYFLANLSDGMAFAVFNVDNTGSVGESFSNSTTNNPIESVFNALSSKARNITNNLSSIANVPILSDAIGLIGDAAAITLSNVSFGLANPLLALAYGATISLPKTWEASSVSLPRASYKIKLISPYGNPYSQLFNMYLPLSMVMAGALPRSTGLDSHTSPFLCQLYDRGRVNVPLGIIDSFSVTRGTSNLAFTRTGTPNAIDIDFSIADLNEIISVDISSSGYLTRMIETLDVDLSDNSFTNYINTITGVDVYSQYYKIPSARLKAAERLMTLKAAGDPAALSAFTVNILPFSNVIGKTLLGNNSKALSELVTR